jgi:hypothetical protein
LLCEGLRLYEVEKEGRAEEIWKTVSTSTTEGVGVKARNPLSMWRWQH